jgi:lambda family phage minor tail protein L
MLDRLELKVQTPTPGKLITLYQLDVSSLGYATVLCFTRDAIDGREPVFRGVSYTPVDVESEGWEWSGNGPVPRPVIRISNVNKVFTGLVRDYDDLVGATLTRIVTFDSFLDGGENANAEGVQFAPDIYRVNRKTKQNKVFIEWELTSSLDQQGIMLPKRQVLRESCTLRYRYYDPETSSFDYTYAECPYTGTSYFDETGASTTASGDRCGRKLGDCKLRFGQNATLPGSFFPGAARYRGR